MQNKSIFLLISVLSFFLQSALIHAIAPKDFSQAKREATLIFDTHRQTLYCGCRYNQNHEVDLTSCNMQAAEKLNRANHIEFEHIVTAQRLGQHLACWKELLCFKHDHPYKGRKCCQKMDAYFKQAEAELYNLWPAVGLINQARSNYDFAELSDEADYYGCRFKVNEALHLVEPDDRVKGIVARAHLFMSDKYGLALTDAQSQLFLSWHQRFPPDDWEKQWAAQIAVIEGYPNPYIN